MLDNDKEKEDDEDDDDEDETDREAADEAKKGKPDEVLQEGFRFLPY